MSRLPRVLAIVLCFFLDVHVHADPLAGPSTGKKTLKLHEMEVVLDHGALMEEREGLHLVRGRIYVQSEERTQIATPFATAHCEGDCRAIFERSNDHVWIQNLEGAWIIQRTGEAQSYILPPAMQVRVAEVGENGLAQMDFPQSLPWAPTLKAWGHLFPGDKNEFKDQVEAFRPRWKLGVERVTQIHQDGAKRTIASYEKAEAEKEAARRREEQENAKLRALFREKNYLSP
jgi:hypothetical protein